MKKSKFTVTQIVGFLKMADAGMSVRVALEEWCCLRGVKLDFIRPGLQRDALTRLQQLTVQQQPRRPFDELSMRALRTRLVRTVDADGVDHAQTVTASAVLSRCCIIQQNL